MLRGVYIGGIWEEEPHKVKEEVKLFFEARFSDSQWRRQPKSDEELKPISNDDNTILLSNFEEVEVMKAMWACDSSKNLGSDGLNFKFIKAFWDIMKSDIMRFMEEFQSNGALPRENNSSFIACIPKCEDPQHLEDFTPISLVECMYKILEKCYQIG